MADEVKNNLDRRFADMEERRHANEIRIKLLEAQHKTVIVLERMELAQRDQTKRIEMAIDKQGDRINLLTDAITKCPLHEKMGFWGTSRLPTWLAAGMFVLIATFAGWKIAGPTVERWLGISVESSEPDAKISSSQPAGNPG